MKRIFTVIAVMMACLSMHAQAELFSKYDNTQGVTTVYVSKSMLSIMPQMKTGGVDISSIAQKLDNISILTCERPSMIGGIKQNASAIYSRDGYEEVMKLNDSDSHTVIYMKQLSGGTNEFALVNTENNVLRIVNIKGRISLRDIQSITH